MLTNSCTLDDYYKEFFSFKTSELKQGNIKEQSLVDYKSLQSYLTGFEKAIKKQLQLVEVNEDMVNKLNVVIIFLHYFS